MRSPASKFLWIFLACLAVTAMASVFALIGHFDLGIFGPSLFSATVVSGAACVFAPVYTEVGKRAANLAIFSLVGIGLISLLVGTHGGLPFGMFTYSGLWWPALELPTGLNFALAAPILWMLIAGASFLTVERWLKLESGITTAVLGGLLAGILSIPLDFTLSAAMGWWRWASPNYPIGGPLLGMPLMSPTGWFLTAAVGGFVLAAYKAEEAASLQAGVALWGLMSLLSLYAALDKHVLGFILLPIFVALLVWTILTRKRLDEL